MKLGTSSDLRSFYLLLHDYRVIIVCCVVFELTKQATNMASTIGLCSKGISLRHVNFVLGEAVSIAFGEPGQFIRALETSLENATCAVHDIRDAK